MSADGKALVCAVSADVRRLNCAAGEVAGDESELPLRVVASSKLPPVIVAVGVQERRSGVCRTSPFQ